MVILSPHLLGVQGSKQSLWANARIQLKTCLKCTAKKWPMAVSLCSGFQRLIRVYM